MPLGLREKRRPLAWRLAAAGAGLAALIGLTLGAGYPASMVATVGAESNLFPTNAAIAALALFQLGLLVLITPGAERLLRRPGVWKPVVAVNVAALTIFLWHMTAYLAVVWAYEGLGFTLSGTPDAGWWAQRWLWVVAPAVVLAGLIALFFRAEVAGRRVAKGTAKTRSAK